MGHPSHVTPASARADSTQYLEDAACAVSDGSKYDPTRKEKADLIICPALAALYANQDINCDDDDGTITKEDLVAGCMKLGCSRFLANKLADGPFKKIGPTVSLFKLAGSPILHFSSTAIRNPKPSEERFAKLAGFADPEGRLHGKELLAAADFFAADPPAHANPNSKATVHVMLATALVVFGRGRKLLTVADLRSLFLESRYPDGWAVRRWGLASVMSWMLYWKSVARLVYKVVGSHGVRSVKVE